MTTEAKEMNPWRHSIADYTDRRVLLILPLGFASGIPLLLTFSTLSAWFATAGVSRAAIGAFALVGTPYAFKFLWSPLIDRLPPPISLQVQHCHRIQAREGFPYQIARVQ